MKMITKVPTKTKWLFQSNIWQEYAYDRLLASAEEAGVDFSMVDVIPFTEDFQQELDFVPSHVFGSNRFVEVCRSHGFPTYKSFAPFEDWYPARFWVNEHGQDITWGKLKECDIGEPMFIKPYREKFFTGLVVDHYSDIDKIQLATSFVDDIDDELIRISPAKNLYKEARFFIIGGVPVSASVYKENGQNVQYPLDESSPAWDACKCILFSGPIDDAFVMDLGLTSKEDMHNNWKIVELNNINSSGLYKTNTDAIVAAFKNL